MTDSGLPPLAEVLTDLPALQRELKSRGLRLQKERGQHFLIDRHVLTSIISTSELKDSDLVLEVGSGLGTLTVPLAASAGGVLTYELDASFAEGLKDMLQKAGLWQKVVLRVEDVLKADLVSELQRLQNRAVLEDSGKRKVVANLPYQITTPLLTHLLEQVHPALHFERMVLMVQEAVAERLVAEPGNRQFGALSVLVRYASKPRLVARVPASAFFPAPQVDSAVVELRMRQTPPVNVSWERIRPVVRAAFTHRRKTIVNSLSLALSIDKQQVRYALRNSGIDAGLRAEALTVSSFARLAQQLPESG